MGVLRVVARAPLLILLATCQVDKLTNNPPPVATLSLAPTEVRDSAAVGSTAMDGDSVAVVNAGPGTMSWSARLAMGGSWLGLVGPTSGTAPARLRLAFNPSGLPTGVYRDTVVVSAENAQGSPGRVPVEFVVHPCMPVPIALNAQLTDSLTTWDCTAPHRVTGFARLYSFAANAGDSVSVVMSSTPVDAYLVLDSSAAATAPPLAVNDSCGGAGRDACFRYLLLRTAGTYFIEATSAGTGQTGRFDLSVTRPHQPAAPTGLAQLHTDSTSAIPLGGSTEQATVVLRGVLDDPDPGDSLRLEVEVRPMGTTFTGTPTHLGNRAPSGQPGFAVVPGLANNTAYHWQARARDQTGRVSAWTSFGGSTDPDFQVVVGVTQLAFTGQPPSTTVAGVTIGPAVQITARDVLGNTMTGFTGNVTMTIAANPGGDTLSGTKTVAATSGVATFSDLSIARAGVGYTLQGAAEGLTVTSNQFTISPAATTRLAFAVQPSTTAAGAAITPAVEVAARDNFGNTTPSFTGSVTIALGANPGSGVLGGTRSATATAGIVRFSNLTIDKAGAGYTLTAAAPGLVIGTSAPFTITAAAAGKLALATAPSRQSGEPSGRGCHGRDRERPGGRLCERGGRDDGRERPRDVRRTRPQRADRHVHRDVHRHGPRGRDIGPHHSRRRPRGTARHRDPAVRHGQEWGGVPAAADRPAPGRRRKPGDPERHVGHRGDCHGRLGAVRRQPRHD